MSLQLQKQKVYEWEESGNVQFLKNRVVKTSDNNLYSVKEAYFMEKIRDAGYSYIPKIYSVKGNIITMKRVYGLTIHEYFKKFPKSKKKVKKQMKKLLEIIIECEILYGDYHNGNFLIDENHKLWIFDFDQAQFVHMFLREDINSEMLYEEELEDAMRFIDEMYKYRNDS